MEVREDGDGWKQKMLRHGASQALLSYRESSTCGWSPFPQEIFLPSAFELLQASFAQINKLVNPWTTLAKRHTLYPSTISYRFYKPLQSTLQILKSLLNLLTDQHRKPNSKRSKVFIMVLPLSIPEMPFNFGVFCHPVSSPRQTLTKTWDPNTSFPSSEQNPSSL